MNTQCSSGSIAITIKHKDRYTSMAVMSFYVKKNSTHQKLHDFENINITTFHDHTVTLASFHKSSQLGLHVGITNGKKLEPC